jgi:hypothetical protein
MGKLRYEGAYSVGAVGVQVTSSGASQLVAIPSTSAGIRARFVRLQVIGSAYVRPVVTTGTCTVNDILLSPNFDVILDVTPYTHIAYLQEAAAARISITPLET